MRGDPGKRGTGERYASVEEAARTLGVGRRAVRDIVRGGKLEVRRDGKGAAARLMVSVASVMRALSERGANGDNERERAIPRKGRMGTRDKRDTARQVANAAGALFQVGATVVASTRIQEAVDEGPPSLVEPAGYAFTIWALIFALSLAYAAYQALPRERGNPLLRRVGPFTAGAFFCTGLWSVFVPFGLFLLALAMLVVVFACLAIAYLRFARPAYGRVWTRPLSRAECWLVALPVGVFLGWITAAVLVSFNDDVLLGLGLVESGGIMEALVGAALLLLGGLLASAAVLVGKGSPPQGYLAYGATVLWALMGIVVNQYDASILTTAAALVSGSLVVLALVGNLFGGETRRR